MEKIIGLIDAPFTPFYENGEVNLEPIPAYAAMLQKNGLQGVFINGSSGEGYMLTDEERMKLAEAWVAAAPRWSADCPRSPWADRASLFDRPAIADRIRPALPGKDFGPSWGSWE